MAEAGTKIVGEADGSAMNPGIQADKYEAAARKAGWKPQEEWEGPDEDWVPAKEFVGRQKLYDKIHDLRTQMSRQSQQFQKDMTEMQKHFAKMEEVALTKAKRELQADLAKAREAGDVDAAIDIAKEIKDVERSAEEAKEQRQQAQQAKGGPTPDFVEWHKDNPWFNTDAEMTADAVAMGHVYAAQNPGKNHKEVLDHVTKKIRRMYPEKFSNGKSDEGEEQQTQGNKKVTNTVEGGQRRQVPTSKKNGQLTKADLSDMELKIMNTLIKRNALKHKADKNKITQEEQYLRDLSDAKAQGG